MIDPKQRQIKCPKCNQRRMYKSKIYTLDNEPIYICKNCNAHYRQSFIDKFRGARNDNQC